MPSTIYIGSVLISLCRLSAETEADTEAEAEANESISASAKNWSGKFLA